VIDSKHTPTLKHYFPELLSDPALTKQLLTYGKLVKLSSEQHICLEGSDCEYLPLILNGSARIYKLGETGREITLYRVEPGDSCILTLSCINTFNAFPAFAISESEVEALLIPAKQVRQWMENHRTWRDYAWSLMASRLSSVISLVEEITFHRMDQRLSDYIATCDTDIEGYIRLTHQNIAADLGTSREVVSRLLKDMQHQKKLELGRSWIKIIKN